MLCAKKVSRLYYSNTIAKLIILSYNFKRHSEGKFTLPKTVVLNTFFNQMKVCKSDRLENLF